MGTRTGNPTWEDYPSTATMMTAEALNNIEQSIDATLLESELDDRAAALLGEEDSIFAQRMRDEVSHGISLELPGLAEQAVNLAVTDRNLNRGVAGALAGLNIQGIPETDKGIPVGLENAIDFRKFYDVATPPAYYDVALAAAVLAQESRKTFGMWSPINFNGMKLKLNTSHAYQDKPVWFENVNLCMRINAGVSLVYEHQAGMNVSAIEYTRRIVDGNDIGVSSSTRTLAITIPYAEMATMKSSDVMFMESDTPYAGKFVSGAKDAEATFQAQWVPVAGIGVFVTATPGLGNVKDSAVITGRVSGATSTINGTTEWRGSPSNTDRLIVLDRIDNGIPFQDGELLDMVAPNGYNPDGSMKFVTVEGVATVTRQVLLSTSRAKERYTIDPSKGYYVRLHKRASLNTARMSNVTFSIDGNQAAVTAVNQSRRPALQVYGAVGAHIQVILDGGWQRGVSARGCYDSDFWAHGSGLPNNANASNSYLNEQAYGYELEFRDATEACRGHSTGWNVRHVFTTNTAVFKILFGGTVTASANTITFPKKHDFSVRGTLKATSSGKSLPIGTYYVAEIVDEYTIRISNTSGGAVRSLTADETDIAMVSSFPTNQFSRLGVPKWCSIYDSTSHGAIDAAFDEHGGSYEFAYFNCRVFFNLSGRNTTNAAGFQHRGAASHYYNCTVEGTTTGWRIASNKFDWPFDWESTWNDCSATDIDGFPYAIGSNDPDASTFKRDYTFNNCFGSNSGETEAENGMFNSPFLLISGSTVRLNNCTSDKFNGAPIYLASGGKTGTVKVKGHTSRYQHGLTQRGVQINHAPADGEITFDDYNVEITKGAADMPYSFFLVTTNAPLTLITGDLKNPTRTNNTPVVGYSGNGSAATCKVRGIRKLGVGGLALRANFSPGAIAPGTATTATISNVDNLSKGDICDRPQTGALHPDGLLITADATADNTIVIKFYNATAAAITPAARDYYVPFRKLT